MTRRFVQDHQIVSRGVRTQLFKLLVMRTFHVMLSPQDEKGLNNFANVIKGFSTKSLSVIIQNQKCDHIQAK